MQVRTVVGIPARDEASWIGRCLDGFARQSRLPDLVLLLLNNCTDRTAVVARRLDRSLPFELRIWCHDFQPWAANAGNARRLVLHAAARLVLADGILLSSDADSVVADDWVERILAAIARGADL